MSQATNTMDTHYTPVYAFAGPQPLPLPCECIARCYLLYTQNPVLTTTTALQAVLAGLYHPAISHTSVLPLGVNITKNPSIALDCKLSYDSRAEASANPGWYRVSKGYPITDRLDAPSERRCRKTPTGCKAQTAGLAGFNVALCRTTGTSRFVCQIMVLNMLAATVGIEPTTYCLTGSRSTF